jgi:hypothetical protein
VRFTRLGVFFAAFELSNKIRMNFKEILNLKKFQSLQAFLYAVSRFNLYPDLNFARKSFEIIKN